MNSLLGLVALLLSSATSTTASPQAPQAPSAVFADLDGTWEGEFVGYDTEGQEIYRISVRQTYRTVDSKTQEVRVTDTFADGRVITGRGQNTAERLPDGSLRLRCVVVKSNDERVTHLGSSGIAPDGEPQLVWHSKGIDRWESFRETVRGQGAEAVYSIDGVGLYGGTVIIMAGRYHQVEEASATAATAPPETP